MHSVLHKSLCLLYLIGWRNNKPAVQQILPHHRPRRTLTGTTEDLFDVGLYEAILF